MAKLIKNSVANIACGKSVCVEVGLEAPYWWYVLYVKSNKERRVVEDFQKAFDTKRTGRELEAFCPSSERYFRDRRLKDSGKAYQKRPLFSGYVFLETNMPEKEFKTAMYDVIYNSPDIIRLLCNGNGSIAVSDSERQKFEYLFRGKRCLDHSVGYIDGDQVIVTVGPLKGFEGYIKKINRHNRTALIEFDMFGQKQTVSVALEIVEKR